MCGCFWRRTIQTSPASEAVGNFLFDLLLRHQFWVIYFLKYCLGCSAHQNKYFFRYSSLISTLITPILREDVKCFGMPDCFPLGFGLPAALMAISIMIFLGGKFLYKIVPPQGNMFLKVCKCIAVSFIVKFSLDSFVNKLFLFI